MRPGSRGVPPDQAIRVGESQAGRVAASGGRDKAALTEPHGSVSVVDQRGWSPPGGTSGAAEPPQWIVVADGSYRAIIGTVGVCPKFPDLLLSEPATFFAASGRGRW